MPNVERAVEEVLVRDFVLLGEPQLGKVQRVRDLGTFSPQRNVFINPSPQSTGIFVEEETDYKSHMWLITPRKQHPSDTTGLMQI